MTTTDTPEPASLPRLLVVDDDPGQWDLLRIFLSSKGFSVTVAPGPLEALDKLEQLPIELVISDVRMPTMTGLEMLHRIRQTRPSLPVLLVTAYADIRDAVEAMRDGAVSYLEKPIDLDELLALVRQACGLAPETPPAEDLPAAAIPAEIVAESPAMRDALHEVTMVAGTHSRVLITGESGAGKGMIAELIHRLSPRCRRPLVSFNCSGGSEDLLEETLFGRETRENGRTGALAEADGGSLLLEEAGDLPPRLQSQLLRFMQTGQFRPLGGAEDRRADVRMLATTAADLDRAVREGRFREDLFYWLNVIEIPAPPLRERRDDILPLAGLFVENIAGRRPRFSASAMACLGAYGWPGNIRELRNAMERAAMMAGDGIVLPTHLPRRVREASAADAPAAETSTMEDVERSVILQTLRDNKFNRSETARRLGISRRTLIYKLRRFQEQGFAIAPEE